MDMNINLFVTAHADALEDLSPGVLAWVGGAWRRAGTGRPHAQATINTLMLAGCLQSSADNLIISRRGSVVRDALRERARRRADNPLHRLASEVAGRVLAKAVS